MSRSAFSASSSDQMTLMRLPHLLERLTNFVKPPSRPIELVPADIFSSGCGRVNGGHNVVDGDLRVRGRDGPHRLPRAQEGGQLHRAQHHGHHLQIWSTPGCVLNKGPLRPGETTWLARRLTDDNDTRTCSGQRGINGFPPGLARSQLVPVHPDLNSPSSQSMGKSQGEREIGTSIGKEDRRTVHRKRLPFGRTRLSCSFDRNSLPNATQQARIVRSPALARHLHHGRHSGSGPHRCRSASPMNSTKMAAEAWPFQSCDCHIANHSPATTRKPTA